MINDIKYNSIVYYLLLAVEISKENTLVWIALASALSFIALEYSYSLFEVFYPFPNTISRLKEKKIKNGHNVYFNIS